MRLQLALKALTLPLKLRIYSSFSLKKDGLSIFELQKSFPPIFHSCYIQNQVRSSVIATAHPTPLCKDTPARLEKAPVFPCAAQKDCPFSFYKWNCQGCSFWTDYALSQWLSMWANAITTSHIHLQTYKEWWHRSMAIILQICCRTMVGV